jgi:hypothetical protein
LFSGGRHFTALVMRQSSQNQSVIGADSDTGREPKAEGVQGFIEQDAGMVAGEGPPGAIGTMHAGRKADNQQPSLRIAKRQHRTGVIVRLAATHLGEESRQARAVGAT